MSTAPVRFVVCEVALYERPVELRLPFRFGVITLTACPQAFARVVIEIASGAPAGRAQGGSAELMVPKWFDKRAELSHAQNIDQLRFAAHAAGTVLHGSLEPATAFDFSLRMTDAVHARANQYDIPPLASGFGPALLERALIDALCRALGCSFFEAARKNLLGVDKRAVAETKVDAGGIERFCMTLQPRDRIAARHTVGLLDPISDAEATSAPNDGLPVSLAGAIRRYGHRAFKLKVAGDLAADLARLRSIARVLDDLPGHWLASLDGNEQFEDVEPVVELLAKMREDTALARLYERIAYIEQPLARARALDVSVAPIDRHKPVIIDESDADETSFVTAHARGYRGVSSKTCKGTFRAFANALRCRLWNEAAGAERYFMTGEDLTAQAGLAVQQDCALVALLGLTHVERNGHHYVNGFANSPEREQRAFLAAHPSLYEAAGDRVRLAIHGGELDLSSLFVPGFATRVLPDWQAMQAMAQPQLNALGQTDRSSYA